MRGPAGRSSTIRIIAGICSVLFSILLAAPQPAQAWGAYTPHFDQYFRDHDVFARHAPRFRRPHGHGHRQSGLRRQSFDQPQYADAIYRSATNSPAKCSDHGICGHGSYCSRFIDTATGYPTQKCYPCLDSEGRSCEAWGDSVDGSCTTCYAKRQPPAPPPPAPPPPTPSSMSPSETNNFCQTHRDCADETYCSRFVERSGFGTKVVQKCYPCTDSRSRTCHQWQDSVDGSCHICETGNNNDKENPGVEEWNLQATASEGPPTSTSTPSASSPSPSYVRFGGRKHGFNKVAFDDDDPNYGSIVVRTILDRSDRFIGEADTWAESEIYCGQTTCAQGQPQSSQKAQTSSNTIYTCPWASALPRWG